MGKSKDRKSKLNRDNVLNFTNLNVIDISIKFPLSPVISKVIKYRSLKNIKWNTGKILASEILAKIHKPEMPSSLLSCSVSFIKINHYPHWQVCANGPRGGTKYMHM